ncbi:hypothetical protein QAD02_013260 [Eretmocerus hayati]|uniref:Uncharacterized protein n=1 Tax=Eretmocerus hayati TaxID=131215 RepID=A0ACC2P2Z6_9HYME|nr:hypothetical protein QAD02_013260 [Eretmocerus hayati]
MSKRGPKSKGSAENILAEALKHDLYEENNRNKLKHVKHDVWTKISESLSNVTPEGLYFEFYKDDYHLLTKYREGKKMDLSYYKEGVSEGSSIVSDEESELGSKNFKKCKRWLEFEINLTWEEWSEISPVLVERVDGTSKESLRDGWADSFIDKIWSSKNIPCPYIFKHQRIRQRNEFIYADGYCKVCGSLIQIRCYAEPASPTPVEFHVRAKNPKNIPHDAKRRLAGSTRTKMKGILATTKPKELQIATANEKMRFKGPKPPNFHSKKVLDTARREGKLEKLGLDGSETIFQAFEKLAKQLPYAKFLSTAKIGFKQFHLSFSSPEQREMAKILVENLKKK